MKSATARLSLVAAAMLLGVLLAATTGSGADQARPTVKAKAAAKKPLRGPRGKRGRRGFRGPRGFTGPMGPNGPAGPAGPPGAAKALYRAAADSSALQTFFTGHGFVLEAACAPFQARARSTQNDGHVVVSGQDSRVPPVPFFAGDGDFDPSEAVNLYQTTGPAKTKVAGTLVVTTAGGAVATYVYAIDFDSVAGACVVTGTISSAP
jgi:hypothetical protein